MLKQIARNEKFAICRCADQGPHCYSIKIRVRTYFQKHFHDRVFTVSNCEAEGSSSVRIWTFPINICSGLDQKRNQSWVFVLQSEENCRFTRWDAVTFQCLKPTNIVLANCQIIFKVSIASNRTHVQR